MTTPSVLFLCVHNAGRSQMAAGWLQHLAGDRVHAYSGGSEPAAEVNPAAAAVSVGAPGAVSFQYQVTLLVPAARVTCPPRDEVQPGSE